VFARPGVEGTHRSHMFPATSPMTRPRGPSLARPNQPRCARKAAGDPQAADQSTTMATDDDRTAMATTHASSWSRSVSSRSARVWSVPGVSLRPAALIGTHGSASGDRATVRRASLHHV